ncbi:AlpA family phage regulatory protein [Burkholderia ambifaria]|uniref:helix-turn-helix transcriptional regulator n=1 Tax=Burkholderia ambifaria TaxID=152480 RepID=UPI00158D4F59
MRKAELSTTTERLLRLPTVISMVGLGKTTIYHMMKEGSFPRPPHTPKPLNALPRSKFRFKRLE